MGKLIVTTAHDALVFGDAGVLGQERRLLLQRLGRAASASAGAFRARASAIATCADRQASYDRRACRGIVD